MTRIVAIFLGMFFCTLGTSAQSAIVSGVFDCGGAEFREGECMLGWDKSKGKVLLRILRLSPTAHGHCKADHLGRPSPRIEGRRIKVTGNCNVTTNFTAEVTSELTGTFQCAGAQSRGGRCLIYLNPLGWNYRITQFTRLNPSGQPYCPDINGQQNPRRDAAGTGLRVTGNCSVSGTFTAELLNPVPRVYPAQQQRCRNTCNKRCCNLIKVKTKLPQFSLRGWKLTVKLKETTVCDPLCQGACRGSLAICKATDGTINIPTPGDAGYYVKKAALHVCNRNFQLFTNAVILSQGFLSAGPSPKLEEAKALLIRTGRFQGNLRFDGVHIRWCRLSGSTGGMVPDRNYVCINENLKAASVGSVARILAHEMKHVEQYRGMGTGEFKCKYTKDLAACGGCQDKRHSLERAAYEFQEAISQLLPP